MRSGRVCLFPKLCCSTIVQAVAQTPSLPLHGAASLLHGTATAEPSARGGTLKAARGATDAEGIRICGMSRVRQTSSKRASSRCSSPPAHPRRHDEKPPALEPNDAP